MKAAWVAIAAACASAGADAQLFWGSSARNLGGGRRTKDTQPMLNVGALNGTLQNMIADVSDLKTGLQSAATSVANLEAKVQPAPPAVPGGMAAFHAVATGQADDAQSEAEASARAEAVARAEEAEEAEEAKEAKVDAPPPSRRPQLSQAVSAKRRRADSHAQRKVEEEEGEEEKEDEEEDKVDQATENEADQDSTRLAAANDDWDRGWSEEDGQEAPGEGASEEERGDDEDAPEEAVVVMQHRKRRGRPEVSDEVPDADAVREAASMAVVHRHSGGRRLRRSEGSAADEDEAKSETETHEGDEEAAEAGEEDDESGEWAWDDQDQANAKP